MALAPLLAPESETKLLGVIRKAIEQLRIDRWLVIVVATGRLRPFGARLWEVEESV
jgi:hypothetical protein